MRAWQVMLPLFLVLACAGLALAGDPLVPIPVPGIPIEGIVVENGGWHMQGTSDNWSWLPPDIATADPSPGGRYLVHNSVWDGDLCRSDVDGSNRVSLTASIGGTNCLGRWSPDSSLIVFQRSPILGSSDPNAPQACHGPFRVWLVNADGSSLQELAGPLPGGSASPSVSPDGYTIAYKGAGGVTLISTDGTDRRLITGAGHPITGASHPAWNRDGSALAVENYVPGTVSGLPGFWRQIVTIDPFGNNPRVVYQRFLASDLADSMMYWAGPAGPVWSPRGAGSPSWAWASLGLRSTTSTCPGPGGDCVRRWALWWAPDRALPGERGRAVPAYPSDQRRLLRALDELERAEHGY